MNNVSKTIGWADFTINPVKGLCPVGCSYCYARRAYSRNCNTTFRDKTIRYEPLQVFKHLHRAKAGDRIFVGSTIDLFHPAVSKWNDNIFKICASWPELIFIFLTKCPENLPKKFPDNCWVGVSATGAEMFYDAAWNLSTVKAKVKLISFEPLLAQTKLDPRDAIWTGINWLIIGLQTPFSKKTAPRIEWVKEIVDAADRAGIPVFLKDNLEKLFVKEYHKTYLTFREETLPYIDLFYPVLKNEPDKRHLRQELPERGK